MAARQETPAAGPLTGVRTLQVGGRGAIAHAAMMLADLGADVVRIDRPGIDAGWSGRGDDRGGDVRRGRRSVALDLKAPEDRERFLALAERADVLMEGYRPGVMERLGLGPADLETRMPGLIYTRITGWGRSGVYADKSGHDLNYVALSGALACIGPSDSPPPPVLNLLGDSAGGMLAAVGVLAALVERAASGRGQTIDVAMLDAATNLMASVYGKIAAGTWHLERGTNFIDGGAPFYGVYETADHRYVSVGAIEPVFYRRLVDALGLRAEEMPQWDREAWPNQRRVFRDVFTSRTRAEWEAHFAKEDCCFAPVLGPGEAPSSPHNMQRGTFVTAEGNPEPAPAPRFGRTPGQARLFHAAIGEHTDEVMAEWTAGPDRSLSLDGGRR